MRITPLMVSNLASPIQSGTANRETQPANYTLPRVNKCDTISFSGGGMAKYLPEYFKQHSVLKNYIPSKLERAYHKALHALVEFAERPYVEEEFTKLTKVYSTAENAAAGKNAKDALKGKPYRDGEIYLFSTLLEANGKLTDGKVKSYLHDQLRIDFAWSDIGEGFLDAPLKFYDTYHFNDPLMNRRLATFVKIARGD